MALLSLTLEKKSILIIVIQFSNFFEQPYIKAPPRLNYLVEEAQLSGHDMFRADLTKYL